jgi:kynurenine formamidase
MCVPGCHEAVKHHLSRRGLFRGAAAISTAAAFAATAQPDTARAQAASFSRVVDLTHTLSPSFPTFTGEPYLKVQQRMFLDQDGYNVFEWTLFEHVGTHLDAPVHFANNAPSADALAATTLVVPLAVIDVTAQAEADPDYRILPADIHGWERANGPLPDNACVAMNSGWDRHVATEKFRNMDRQGVMHFPGFHPDTAELLIAERRVRGIAVDTLSLDHGPSKDFSTHATWLPSGRWGLECVANLGQCPPKGATIVVGGPKIQGATGGPSRVFALV